MENIELVNYRCFTHLTLSFKKRVNLLIGDNSSGKSTLIQALSSVMNSFFSGYSDKNTRFSGLSKDDFTVTETETGLANDLPIFIQFRFLGVNAALELHSTKGRTLQKPLEPIAQLGKELYQNLFDENKTQVRSLPLIASFSTADIHANRKIAMTPFKEYEHKPSFGYFECLQGNGFFDYWTKRLLILQEANKGTLEIEGVKQAILNALGKDGCNIIQDVAIRHNQGKVYYIFIDQREIETDKLSDGYRRLVNIVMDVAFRCMLLNKGIFGKEACQKTEGTVLIDEIDLHLHPTLQALVMKGLQNAFPNLQFIITTHAPMVMTGIPQDESNIIYKLDFTKEEGYTAKPMELYGMDASTIIEVGLDTIPRSKEVDDKLKRLFDYIDADDYKKASEYLITLRKEVNENLPDLAKAEAMLNFFNADNDQDK